MADTWEDRERGVMQELDLAEMRHRRDLEDPTICNTCCCRWPCPTERLCDEVGQLRDALRAVWDRGLDLAGQVVQVRALCDTPRLADVDEDGDGWEVLDAEEVRAILTP